MSRLTTNLRDECAHGTLRRKCGLCQRDEEIERLNELREYVRHAPTCAADVRLDDPRCTCGLTKLLESLK